MFQKLLLLGVTVIAQQAKQMQTVSSPATAMEQQAKEPQWSTLPTAIAQLMLGFLTEAELQTVEQCGGREWQALVVTNEPDWQERSFRLLGPLSARAISAKADSLLMSHAGSRLGTTYQALLLAQKADGGWLSGTKNNGKESKDDDVDGGMDAKVEEDEDDDDDTVVPVMRIRPLLDAASPPPTTWHALWKILTAHVEDWTGLKRDGQDLPGLTWGVTNPYSLYRSRGTTDTEVPDAATGRYAEPVFFDFARQWARIKPLFDLPEVTATLRAAIDDICTREGNSRDYYITPWDKVKGRQKYPFDFVHHRRYGNGEQDDLIREIMPAKQRRELIVLNLQLKQEYSLESGVPIPDEVTDGDYAEVDAFYNEGFMQHQMHRLEPIYRSFIDTQFDDARLLLGVMWPRPFNHLLARKLAELLFPESKAELKCQKTSAMAVAWWPRRNIVFDLCWFFVHGQTAIMSLQESIPARQRRRVMALGAPKATRSRKRKHT